MEAQPPLDKSSWILLHKKAVAALILAGGVSAATAGYEVYRRRHKELHSYLAKRDMFELAHANTDGISYRARQFRGVVAASFTRPEGISLQDIQQRIRPGARQVHIGRFVHELIKTQILAQPVDSKNQTVVPHADFLVAVGTDPKPWWPLLDAAKQMDAAFDPDAFIASIAQQTDEPSDNS